MPWIYTRHIFQCRLHDLNERPDGFREQIAQSADGRRFKSRMTFVRADLRQETWAAARNVAARYRPGLFKKWEPEDSYPAYASGIARRIKVSNSGTVNAVWPYPGV